MKLFKFTGLQFSTHRHLKIPLSDMHHFSILPGISTGIESAAHPQVPVLRQLPRSSLSDSCSLNTLKQLPSILQTALI